MLRHTPSPGPERRTRADLAVTAGITVTVVAVVAGAWLHSDARGTDHTTAGAGGAVAPSSTTSVPVPTAVEQRWRTPTDASVSPVPVTLDGAVVSTSDRGISVLDADDGHEVWHYRRNRELCGVGSGWSRIVTVFRGPKGCGDATSFTVSTGQYVDTRSALAPDTVSVFQSLDHIGLLGTDRVELWRSDLVRTVETGHREIVVNPGTDIRDGCTFTSALTRKSVLAVATDCPGASDGDRTVSLLDAEPKEADEPETTHDFTVPSGSELVAVGQNAAVIYVPGSGVRAVDPSDDSGSRFQVLRTDGSFEQYPADPSPLFRDRVPGTLFVPRTADLPHHMTWFDGERLIAFGPTTLEPRFSLPALGTGAAMGQRLLVPVKDGIAVVDWSDGHTEKVLPVDRGSWTGPVTLKVQGDTVIEQRGDELVGLTASYR